MIGLTLEEWLLHSALAGGIVTLAGCGLVMLTRRPARRQRLAEGTVLAGIALAAACLLPTWLRVPMPALKPALVQGSQPVRSPGPRPTRGQAAIAPEPAQMPDIRALPDESHKLDGLKWTPAETKESVLQPRAAMVDAAPGEAGRVQTPARPGFHPGMAVLGSLAAVAFLAGAAFFLSRWLLGYLAVIRIVQSARAAPSLVKEAFARVAGPRSRARVLVSPRVQVPLSFGLLRPTVILPTMLCGADAADRLHWVLAHELTHLRRCDAIGCILLGLGQVIYFYLPWLWWLRRQVRLCREVVADAAAMEAFDQRVDYAEFLIGLVGRPAVPAGATGVLGSSSDLFWRVRMLLNHGGRVETQCPRAWSITVAVAFLTVGLLAGGVGLRAEAPVSQPPDPPSVTRADNDEDAIGEKAQHHSQPRRATRTTEPEQELEALRAEAQRLEEQLKRIATEQKMLMASKEKSRKALEASQAGKHRTKALDPLTWYFDFHQAQAGGGRLGLTIETVGPTLRDQLDLPKGQGMIVQQVASDSAAAKGGLKANDILLELDGKKVPSDGEDLRKLVKALQTNHKMDVVVLRKGHKLTLSLTAPEPKAETGLSMSGDGGVDGGLGGGAGVGLGGGADGGLLKMSPYTFLMAPLAGQDTRLRPFVTFTDFGDNRDVMTSIYRTGDRFTGRHQEGSLVITVTGRIWDGKAKADLISIRDKHVLHRIDRVADVPQVFRDKVKRLIESAQREAPKVEVQSDDK